jgi:hypothetical protein
VTEALKVLLCGLKSRRIYVRESRLTLLGQYRHQYLPALASQLLAMAAHRWFPLTSQPSSTYAFVSPLSTLREHVGSFLRQQRSMSFTLD